MIHVVVNFICTECPIGIDEKLFTLRRRAALRLLLDESIKSIHSVASYFTPLIWSIQQCCCNKPMITYPGTWKTVLVLSHGLNTSRMLFLVPTDVSLWDVNPVTKQTPSKGSCLMSVQLMSRVLAGHPFWLICIIPSYNSHVTMFESELYFMLSGSGTRRSGPWRRNIAILDMVLVLAIYSF